MKKEIGLLIYMMGMLMVASPDRFGFKEDVHPSYHHTVFDRDRIGKKLLKLEKEIAFGPITKKDEDGCFTVTKPKRNMNLYIRTKIIEIKCAFKPMPNYKTHEEWAEYIRKRTLDILYKYYNMEESDFVVTKEAKVKLIGDKNTVAADWVYRKYGKVNPRPTFIRTRDNLGNDIYVIECPPEWEDVVSIDGQQYWDGRGRIKSGDLVIFAPLDFGEIIIKLRVPLYIPLYNRVAEPAMLGSVVALSFFLEPFVSPVIFGLAKVSPLSRNITHEQLTEIINVKDKGIIGDGIVDETDNLEALHITYIGRVLFHPLGTYNVDQYGSRTAGGYTDIMGPAILAGTTIVGEGNGTEFVALANALYMFYINSNNITIRDVRFTGTGVAGAGNLSSGAFYGQGFDNLNLINVTSNDMIGGGGINSRGILVVGGVGHLMQDCHMDSNQHGVVIGSPPTLEGFRMVNCFSSNSVEWNYYYEGAQDGSVQIACTSYGTGRNCYCYVGAVSEGLEYIGNPFLSSGNGPEPYGLAEGTGWSENICSGTDKGMYPQTKNSSFIGNVITHNDGEGFYALTNFEYNLVDDNIMSYNTGQGIYLQNSSPNNILSHNVIIDNTTDRGIWMRGGDNNRLLFNRVYSSNTGTYHTQSGLQIGIINNLYLMGNDLRDGGAVAYIDAGTNTIWASGNFTEALT